jgi:hypothetical protein
MLDPNGDREYTQLGPHVYLQTNATYHRPGRPQLAEMLEAYAFHLRAQHAAIEVKLAADPTCFTHDDNPEGWSALELRGAQCLDVRLSLLKSAADRAMCESYGKADEAAGGAAFALTPEQSAYRRELYKRIDRHVDWDCVRCECSVCRPQDEGGLSFL